MYHVRGERFLFGEGREPCSSDALGGRWWWGGKAATEEAAVAKSLVWDTLSLPLRFLRNSWKV